MSLTDRILCALNMHDWKAASDIEDREFFCRDILDVKRPGSEYMRTCVTLQCQKCGAIKESRT